MHNDCHCQCTVFAVTLFNKGHSHSAAQGGWWQVTGHADDWNWCDWLVWSCPLSSTPVSVTVGSYREDSWPCPGSDKAACWLRPYSASRSTGSWITWMPIRAFRVGSLSFTDLVYADDTTLFATSSQSAAESLSSFQNAASAFGMHISWPMTKVVTFMSEVKSE